MLNMIERGQHFHMSIPYHYSMVFAKFYLLPIAMNLNSGSDDEDGGNEQMEVS